MLQPHEHYNNWIFVCWHSHAYIPQPNIWFSCQMTNTVFSYTDTQTHIHTVMGFFCCHFVCSYVLVALEWDMRFEINGNAVSSAAAASSLSKPIAALKSLTHWRWMGKTRLFIPIFLINSGGAFYFLSLETNQTNFAKTKWIEGEYVFNHNYPCKM